MKETGNIKKEGIIHPFKNFPIYLFAMFAGNTLMTLILSPSNFSSLKGFAIASVWGTLIWVTQSLGIGYIFQKIDKQISWLEQPLKRAVAGIAGMVTYSSIAYLVVQVSMNLIFYGGLPGNFLDWAWESVQFCILISFSVSLLLTAVGFLMAWRKAEFNRQELKTEMLAYRYESLRNQINPHFLFNSFNVLTELVYEDQGMAVKFIRQLSDLYRYVLDIRDKELVPLKEELEFIHSFIFLMETRFEDRFKVQLEVEPLDTDLIVPMALQILVENAVKHNEASGDNPLHVQIKRVDNTIVVTNPIQPKSIGDESKKIGLSNLKQQFSHLSNRELVVKDDGKTFKVILPILEMVEEK